MSIFAIAPLMEAIPKQLQPMILVAFVVLAARTRATWTTTRAPPAATTETAAAAETTAETATATTAKTGTGRAGDRAPAGVAV